MNLIELEHRYIENPKHVIDNMLKIKIDAFGDNYRQAQAYYEEHGNSNITKISGSLGQWINDRKNKLQEAKIVRRSSRCIRCDWNDMGTKKK